MRAHEDRMASKIVERERKLVEHAMRSRRRAQEDEAAKIARDLKETARNLSEAEAQLNVAANDESTVDGEDRVSSSSASTGETAEQLAKRAMDMIRRHEQRQEEIEKSF